jgi:hypothetical protein
LVILGLGNNWVENFLGGVYDLLFFVGDLRKIGDWFREDFHWFNFLGWFMFIFMFKAKIKINYFLYLYKLITFIFIKFRDFRKIEKIFSSKIHQIFNNWIHKIT